MITPDYYIQKMLSEARERSLASEDEIMRSKRRAWWWLNATVTPNDWEEKGVLGTYVSTYQYVSSCVSRVYFSEKPDNYDKDCLGLYTPSRDRTADTIWVWSGLNWKGRIRTLIHELAHCLTHPSSLDVFTSTDIGQMYREQAAEAVAYVVCKWLGVEVHDYSQEYIALCMKGANRHTIKVEGLVRVAMTIYCGINARRIRING